eukprot:850611-Prymnesium_polylepis.1
MLLSRRAPEQPLHTALPSTVPNVPPGLCAVSSPSGGAALPPPRALRPALGRCTPQSPHTT